MGTFLVLRGRVLAHFNVVAAFTDRWVRLNVLCDRCYVGFWLLGGCRADVLRL